MLAGERIFPTGDTNPRKATCNDKQINPTAEASQVFQMRYKGSLIGTLNAKRYVLSLLEGQGREDLSAGASYRNANQDLQLDTGFRNRRLDLVDVAGDSTCCGCRVPRQLLEPQDVGVSSADLGLLEHSWPQDVVPLVLHALASTAHRSVFS